MYRVIIGLLLSVIYLHINCINIVHAEDVWLFDRGEISGSSYYISADSVCNLHGEGCDILVTVYNVAMGVVLYHKYENRMWKVGGEHGEWRYGGVHTIISDGKLSRGPLYDHHGLVRDNYDEGIILQAALNILAENRYSKIRYYNNNMFYPMITEEKDFYRVIDLSSLVNENGRLSILVDWFDKKTGVMIKQMTMHIYLNEGNNSVKFSINDDSLKINIKNFIHTERIYNTLLTLGLC